MSTKQAHKPKVTHESVETIHASGTVAGSFKNVKDDIVSNLWNTLITGGKNDLSSQIFGETPGSTHHGQELHPGQAASLKAEKKSMAPRSEGHMEYFRKVQNADLLSQNKEDASMDRRVEEIRSEIRKLLATSKQLENTIKQVTVENKVVNAGVYHENFFHFVLALLRSARVRMEEGMSWAGTAKAKKGQQGKKQQQQYWNMEQKHGTSFSLSSERSTATQTG